ncbi:hypothetical protein CQW23_22940 [Capsicum baccatum]|uniref:Uncharacterized protein n=1 Tax=Capsicum baccatum TaxID=33114 RepID=A0A2G2W299_CAPBA|nr:hypothetical protein CQW23_22940 [Capsicum baccatum]
MKRCERGIFGPSRCAIANGFGGGPGVRACHWPKIDRGMLGMLGIVQCGPFNFSWRNRCAIVQISRVDPGSGRAVGQKSFGAYQGGAMAGNGESVVAETKKIMNPSVEIDTSPPFESVKEAVEHFGGSGPWIPHHLLHLPPPDHDSEVVDVGKMEEQDIKFEKDLIVKEREALNALREVEEAKRFVEGLKGHFDRSSRTKSLNSAAELSIMENNTMNKELQQLSSEAEQFKKMTEASRYETERHYLMERILQHATEGITIPYEEFYALAWKAQQAEELYNNNNKPSVFPPGGVWGVRCTQSIPLPLKK